MLANLIVHPSGYNGNQSQQSLQWTHLVKHQSEINQSQAIQAIPECNCPIGAWKARHTIPECIMLDRLSQDALQIYTELKRLQKSKTLGQAELQSSRLEDKLTQPQHLRRLGKRHKA